MSTGPVGNGPAPGWYPDPDGTPGRLRYYDGRAWTANVRKADGAGRGRFAAMITGGVIVLVIIIVGVVVLTRQTSGAFTNTNLPTATVSGWDDSSPTAEPSAEPTPTDTPSGTASGPPSARPVACDLASSNQLPDPPNDDRVHGGPLSFDRLPRSWSAPFPTGRFPYSRDAQVQTQRMNEDLPWESSAQVGVLTFDDQPDGEKATAGLLQCVVTSDFYTSVDVTIAENKTTAIKIGSTPATRLDALLTFSHPQLKTKGSLVRIIVVDSSPRTYYFHAVPMERDDLVAELDAATESLAVS